MCLRKHTDPFSHLQEVLQQHLIRVKAILSSR